MRNDMTGRRDFIGVGAWALLSSLLPEGAMAADAKRRVTFRPRKVEVKCGLAKPFTILHISDTHLVLMSEMEKRNVCRAELYDKRIRTYQSRLSGEGLAAALARAIDPKLAPEIVMEYPSANFPAPDGTPSRDPVHSALFGTHFERLCRSRGIACTLLKGPCREAWKRLADALTASR